MPRAKIGSFDAVRAAKFADRPEWDDVTWRTYRLKVEGGWLYRYGYSEAMTFVPERLERCAP